MPAQSPVRYMQAMIHFKFSLALLLLHFFSFCQIRPFEIEGTITGNYNSKIYLFFEGNYRQRDSISSEIKDGKFHFKGAVTMPIQCRLHMGQQSLIPDLYIDNSKTLVKCTTEFNLYNKDQDTLNLLSVVSVKNSTIDNLKSEFEIWLEKLKKSKVSDEEKREAYYKKLSVFIKAHPKSKLSPYLLGKASFLFYSQVKELSFLIDTSLNKAFETKSIKYLLNQLDKSKNSNIGVAFQDFTLRDSNNHEINLKQHREKYTLVVCWASWCKPCRAEHPDLNTLYEKYKGKGFEIIGVSLDTEKEKWTNAIIKDGLKWTQVIDPKAFDGEMAKYYGIESIPTNFLLDKAGKILGVHLTPNEIEEMIIKFL